LKNRLDIAGIHVVEARIGHLATHLKLPGLCCADSKQQQWSQPFKIVEGAVSMVQMALEHLPTEYYRVG